MTTKRVKIKNNIPKVINGLSSLQLNKLGHAIGVRFEDELVKRIQEGDPKWAALSPEWIEKKGHGRKWYYTGRTEGAIKYKVKGSTIYAGWVDGGELADIAKYLEYGTSKMPARPLIVPVFEENKDKIVKDAKVWIKNAVNKGRIL